MSVVSEADLLRRFGFFKGALYVQDIGLCVVSDVHIGLAEALYRQGLHFPLHEEETLLERFEAVLDRFEPEVFVLDGDVFHSFDRVSRGARETLSKVVAAIRAECEAVLVRGSHDTMLQAVAGNVVDRYDRNGYTVVHGDRAVDDHGTLIIGHDHPTIEIDMARFPCFLYGRGVAQGRDLIVMPAFNPLSPGVTVNYAKGRDFLSPVLRRVDAGTLQPVVEADGEAVVFPPLAGLRRFA
ncbi:metallophosphoesterase [Methanoculleus sp. 7T]|jgi:putative SbcD/Mre11-related phosphoesterase|uniref:metallophosphoesterase n=1 Tax=Methanoculleus sp. 7T TaxID=2937282 RepID=UPI0020BE5D8F|nr:metallophosphoesterase [Methanoculleus sp. 7T]MCK8519499.1 phosphoesterase [Methanoculleus sp. 7T]